MFIQIEPSAFTHVEDERVAGHRQVVPEYDYWFSCRYLCKVVFQPFVNISRAIRRRIVASHHRSHDIMDVPGIERIIDRSVKLFEQLFSIFSFYQIVIPDRIKDRDIHIGRIHQTDMVFQPVLVADIPSVHDERNFFIGGIITKVLHPIGMFVIRYGTVYFSV